MYTGRYRLPLVYVVDATKVARFGSATQLRRHFLRHGAEFGTTTEADYEALASYICDDPLRAGVDECIRNCPGLDTDPKRIRFYEATGEYAVMVRDTRVLCTYHLLYPAGTIGAPYTHQFATNRDFFEADCNCRA